VVTEAPVGAARTSIPEVITAQERPYEPKHDLCPELTHARPRCDIIGPMQESLPQSSSPGAQVVPTVGSDGGEVKGVWGQGWQRRLGCRPSRLTLGDAGF
jgi:hypothetical protein